MANLMDLVRELKALNARKKAGEALSEDENTRRRELKKYLKTALANQSSTGSATGGPVSSTGPAIVTPPSSPGAVSSNVATRSPTPTAMRSPTPPSMVAAGARPAPIQVNTPPSAPARNPFAINAEALFEEAAASSAVNALTEPTSPSLTMSDEPSSDLSDVSHFDELAGMNPLDAPERASRADLECQVARASKAAKANRPKNKAKKIDEVEAVWEEVHERNGYTPPEVLLNHEDYFGGYLDEGMHLVDATATKGLAPIDPREIELHRAGLGGTGKIDHSREVPAGLVFLDDFVGLYARGGLSGPADEVEPDIDDPNLLIPGKRKVTVHLLAGGVKRGIVSRFARGALGFALEPDGRGQVEELSIGQIKAMFVHKAKGKTPVASGRDLTVTFRDGKSVKGASDDYAAGTQVFTLVPAAGQFELIVVNAGAAASIA